jgi:hypothetical protein
MTRRRWWILALLTMIPTVGLLVWLNRPGVLHFPVQQVVLTNGTTLQLVSVQVGRVHTDPFSPPWQQWAARLPENLTRRLKLKLPPNLNVTGSNAVLSVWLTASKAPVNPNQPAYVVLVGDDDGNFAGEGGGIRVTTGKTPLVAHYEAHGFPIFPRRARELRIRIYGYSSPYDQFLHEFRVPNPAQIPTNELPPLTAQPLPQSQTSGDLEATLMSLLVSRGGSPFAEPMLRMARLEFAIRQAGKPSTNWVSHRVRRVFDATGNEGESNGWIHGWEKDRAFVAFSIWPLPAGEPWGMEVEFCQRHGFASNELWEARDIPIVASGAPFTPMTHRFHGTEVQIQGLRPSHSPDSETSGKREVELFVRPRTPPDSRHWHVSVAKAIDSTGLEVTRHPWSVYEAAGVFRFQVSSNATSLHVWIACTPSRVMEFIAQPSVNPGPVKAQR